MVGSEKVVIESLERGICYKGVRCLVIFIGDRWKGRWWIY